jgi:hypothetical protein
MPVCPDGHQSVAADFCNTCGMRIEGPPAATAAGPESGGSGAAGGGPSCPQCGTAQSGQFCEVCGFDFTTGAPASPSSLLAAAGADPGGESGASGEQALGDPATSAGAVSTVNLASAGQLGASEAAAGPAWTAVVSADHDYYDAVVAAGGPDASSIEFPGYCPERRFTLTGPEMRIGRRSVSRGLEPEIDLTGPPTDPGISHLHAVLIGKPDGTWSVLDPGSSNGTQVNGDDIATGVEVPLHSGDRVGLGAWTVLTVQSP